MAYSYSLIIVMEVLVLVPFITYSLLASKQTASVNLGKKKLNLVIAGLFIGSVILFLAPKLNLIYDYDYTKLTADSWAHYFITKGWSDTGSLQTTNYPYYSTFPVTYAPQLILHYVTGLSAFDSMTVYYIVAGIAGLLIIFGISREIIRGSNSEKMLFAGIAGVIYSFLQYFNLLFVQQYPLAIGMLAALFCVYSFALLANRRKRSTIYLYILAALLSFSHPFALILIPILFLVYFLLGRVKSLAPNPYRGLVSRRIALSMSAIVVVAGMMYMMFVVSDVFENGIMWSELNAKYTWQKVTSQLVEETTSGVGNSFEGRYQGYEAIIYPLNWALPTASSAGMVIFFLLRRSYVSEDQVSLLPPLAIVSTLLFVLSFAFSFTELAFSRYFGAFALAFNIPVTAYVIYRVVVAAKTSSKLKTNILRYALIGIMSLAVVASVTDPTTLPKIVNESTVYRNTEIYPSELELIAWEDFYSSLGDNHRLIRTNLNAGPAQYYRSTHDYDNIIVSNPKNYTMTSDNAYLVIDKERLDLGKELQENSYFDKVYDNSAIYFGR